jgi:membrane-associated protein
MIDFIMHIDKYLLLIVARFGFLSYGILFLVIFAETGLVILPFLPGDSVLFAAGALSAKGGFNIWFLYWLIVAAAFLGDTVNYWIGHFIGPRAFRMNSKFLKREYLDKAQKFYKKHGGKAIIMARFVPVVRTFAPFVAGAGRMKYRRFFWFNLVGGLLWVALFLWGGYFLGEIPWIKANFRYMVGVIILISIVPVLIEVIRAKHLSN